MLVLGIDPGSMVTGYGLVRDSNGELECIENGCIRNTAKTEFGARLKKIHDEITGLIEKFQPDQVAFEDIFYGRNVRALIQLGQARGAAIIAALNAHKPVVTYAPREVKLAITGFGGASKEQVQKMVIGILKLDEAMQVMDVSDALAIAICHINRFNAETRLNKNIR
ncbi:MAG TPA: crossover junction endodeoxyribonuclease RuvC [bacterium]|nr:crossover junction endodeoxyribonuclease RuvC [bacterium]HPN41889.1 crossover junction endodeoxyribonuclease RuvC [bacterium]